MAAISNASGTHNGVRRLSELSLILNSFLLMVILITGKPFFYLNLYVQSIGFYFQNLIGFGFHCDAFERLGPSFGAEDRNRYESGLKLLVVKFRFSKKKASELGSFPATPSQWTVPRTG